MGEAKGTPLKVQNEPIALDTFGGRIHAQWDPAATVTPLGQLPFFIDWLSTSGLFEAWVKDCSLRYKSNNGSSVRAVLSTFMVSILSGHQRYAHISSMRCDGVHPALLGIKKFVSEDAARRALNKMDEAQTIAWLDKHLAKTTAPLLSSPWILDLDATVKCLYGDQEGAVAGYNPTKPGRPSHSYHTGFMANTRLAINVEVMAGNQTAPSHSMGLIWKLIAGLAPAQRPQLLRGDVAFGTEPTMAKAEALGQLYLTKLRLTTKVKLLIKKLFQADAWTDAGQGWMGAESTLQLNGWSKPRRVVVLRRKLTELALITDIQGEAQVLASACTGADTIESSSTSKGVEVELLPNANTADATNRATKATKASKKGADKKSRNKGAKQQQFAFLDDDSPTARYEYAVLITSTDYDIFALAQLYRDRADVENNFDELKNQWGWGGYTTKDIKRCRIISRMVALIYNWWTLFVRTAQPQKHFEAITSRPLLLHATAVQTKHAGQTTLTITSTHAKQEKIQAVLTNLAAFLNQLKSTAEQLTDTQRLHAIMKRAFGQFMMTAPKPPALLMV